MSFLFPSLSRRFVPTVLQMVQVHYSLCTYSILFCLHPLSIWLLFFLFALFTCNVHSWFLVCWSAYVTNLKQMYHHHWRSKPSNKETISLHLFCCECFLVVCLPWCTVDPYQMGRSSPNHKKDQQGSRWSLEPNNSVYSLITETLTRSACISPETEMNKNNKIYNNII